MPNKVGNKVGKLIGVIFCVTGYIPLYLCYVWTGALPITEEAMQQAVCGLSWV